MEKNKLDKLFDDVRSTEPSVSFDEAIEQFNMKASESRAATERTSQWKYAIFAVFAVLILGGGAYFVLNNNTAVETTPQPVESATSVTKPSEPAKGQNTTEVEEATPATAANENVAEPLAETSTSDVMKKEAEPAPLKNKVTHVENKAGSYILENQTVNINNEDGQFKVFFRGGDIDKVTLNNNEVQSSEWSRYADVLTEAKSAMNKMGVDKENTASSKFVEYLFSTLKKKGLIENNLATVKLSSDALLIEGHEADSAIHQQLLHQFKAMTGQELGNRTLYFN